MFFCVAFFSSPMLQKQPNAGPELLPQAGAQRTLEAVSSRPLFGAAGLEQSPAWLSHASLL